MIHDCVTLIIGGGQAGLSVARFLKEENIPFIILEKNSFIGQSWHDRYDSLVLDSFAKYSYLEDFPFLGSSLRHPHKDEVVKYLDSFADHFGLHPKFNTEVLKIEKHGENFLVHTKEDVYRSRFVVLATGPFQNPFIPTFGKDLPSGIFQIHSKYYKNSNSLKPGDVLIVGGGNSGIEMVEELSALGRKIFFSYKGKLKSVQSTPFSQWMAYRLGLAHLAKDSLLGKFVIWYTKGKSVGMDVKPLLARENVLSVGEFIGMKEGNMKFTQEIIPSVANIIWATGYKNDFSIISIPGFDPEKQKRGVSNIPGLYVLNIRWQYSKSSSHLAGVSRDAKYIAMRIIKERQQHGNQRSDKTKANKGRIPDRS